MCDRLEDDEYRIHHNIYSNNFTNDDIISIGCRMHSELVKNNNNRIIFSGRKIVKWMIHSKTVINEKEGIHLGNYLIDSKILYSINNNNKFDSSDRLFEINEDILFDKDININKLISKKWYQEVISPFERLDPNPNYYEILKLLFGICSILPIKIILILIIFIIYYIICRISVLLLLILSKSKTPLEYFIFRLITKIATRIILILMGFYTIEINGIENISFANETKNSIVLVSNHLSHIEVLYYIYKFCPSFVCVKQYTTIPLISFIAINIFQCVPIERALFNTTPFNGTKLIQNKIKQMDKITNSNYPKFLVIFPEGTTSNGNCLLNFHKGAFLLNKPVFPVVVNFSFQYFSPTYESIYTFTYFIRLLTQFRNYLFIEFLPVYSPDKTEQKNSLLYSENVRNLMANKLHIHCINSEYKNKIKYHTWLRLQYEKHPFGILAKLLLVSPFNKNIYFNDNNNNKQEQFHVIRDISYYPLNNSNNNLLIKVNKNDTKYQLDLFLPNSNSNNNNNNNNGLPLVIFVHGGGWQRGDRRCFRYFLAFGGDTNLLVFILQRFGFHCYSNIGASFARSGVACAVISYHLTKLEFPFLLVEIISSAICNFIVLFIIFSYICYGLIPNNLLLIINNYLYQIKLFLVPNVNLESTHLFFEYISGFIISIEINHINTIDTLFAIITFLLILWLILPSEIALLYLSPIQRGFPRIALIITLILDLLIGIRKFNDAPSHPFIISISLSFIITFLLSSIHFMHGIYYQLYKNKCKHPQHACDVAKSVYWAITNGKNYGINPLQISLVGHSAGGHLVSLLAIDPSYLTSVGLSTNCIKCVISICGVYDLSRLSKSFWQKHLYLSPAFDLNSQIWINASPIKQLDLLNNNNMPPFLLINAENDFHLIDDANEFEKALLSHNTIVHKKIIKNRNHFSVVMYIQDSAIHTKRDIVMELCDEFLNKYLIN